MEATRSDRKAQINAKTSLFHFGSPFSQSPLKNSNEQARTAKASLAHTSVDRKHVRWQLCNFEHTHIDLNLGTEATKCLDSSWTKHILKRDTPGRTSVGRPPFFRDSKLQNRCRTSCTLDKTGNKSPSPATLCSNFIPPSLKCIFFVADFFAHLCPKVA